MRHLIGCVAVWAALAGIPGCGSADPESASTEDPGKETAAASKSPKTAAATTDKANGGSSNPDPRSSSETEGPGKEQPATSPPFVFEAPNLSPEEVAAGWVSLFDGHSLFGWTANSSANWRVEDGAIVADAGDPGLLLTPFRMNDFELRCEFHLEPGGNSGVFLRTVADPKDVLKDCYELNLCDTHPQFKTGSLVGRHKPAKDWAVEDGWHRFDIRFEGATASIKIDGEDALEYTDDTDAPIASGFLGLQMNGGRIAFRNIHYRPLGGIDLFNGQDLTDWRPVPGGDARFSVEEGSIRVVGGAGFLETEGTYGNFVLQLEAKTNSPGVNSGVFFRAEPGSAEAPSNGYELQVCNLFADGDRTRPNDYGTGFGSGAIFRFAPARYVVSSDGAWSVMTLIADENRLTSFVDGYLVAVWEDSRKADSNPRRGQRLQPGHISLQGHDPGTDASFRRIRLAPVGSTAE